MVIALNFSRHPGCSFMQRFTRLTGFHLKVFANMLATVKRQFIAQLAIFCCINVFRKSLAVRTNNQPRPLGLLGSDHPGAGRMQVLHARTELSGVVSAECRHFAPPQNFTV